MRAGVSEAGRVGPRVWCLLLATMALSASPALGPKAACAQAQDPLPVIKASSKQVSIQDGLAYLKDVWGLAPEAELDTYYVMLPEKGSEVTFITDLDSISFETEFGKSYDFIILLDGQECRTRISATYHGVHTPERLNANADGSPEVGPFTVIPFTMRGSRIYLEGTVNGHAGLAIQLDLGAGATCVNVDSGDRSGVVFDGKALVTNTDGTNEQPQSSQNTIVIGNLKWEQVPIIQVGNMESDEDLIVGNTLFGRKVVEIDYDEKVLRVSDKLEVPPAGYTSHDIILEQHRPLIQASFTVGSKNYSDWFLFDTGRDGTMVLGEEICGKYELWDKLDTLIPLGSKQVVYLDEVALGGLTFKEIVTNAVDPAAHTGRKSLLGNEILNHFNVILDNPHGVIYLKPNALPNKTYSNYAEFKQTMLLWGSVTIVVLALLSVLLFKLWKRRRARKRNAAA